MPAVLNWWRFCPPARFLFFSFFPDSSAYKNNLFLGVGELCNQRPPHPPAPPLQKKFLQSPVLYRCSPPSLVYTAAWVPLVPVFRADLGQQASYPWSRPRPELALVLATSWPLLGLFFFWVCPLACLPLHDSSKLRWDKTGCQPWFSQLSGC